MDGGITWTNVGAPAATYVVNNADTGFVLRVMVSYVDGMGTAETVYSAATPTIAGSMGAVAAAPAGNASGSTQQIVVDVIPDAPRQTQHASKVTSVSGPAHETKLSEQPLEQVAAIPYKAWGAPSTSLDAMRRLGVSAPATRLTLLELMDPES